MTSLLGTLLGYRVARRFFAEPCPWLALALAPLLGVFLTLLLGGMLLRFMSWWPWLLLVNLLFAVGIWYLGRTPGPSSDFPPPSRWLLLYLVPAGTAVLIFCWFHQSVGMVVDGDFFIHAANIGLFTRGYLPPVNPFSGVPMNGHYGRDLAIAIFSRDTGLAALDSEWVLTTIWQLLTFFVLFFWLRRETGDDTAAVLGSGLAYFGMNISSAAGLCELLANNNPAAFSLMIVTGWAVFRATDPEAPRWAWLGAASLLGLDSMIYETHFGVLGLSLLVFLRRCPKRVLSLGIVALTIAACLSGVLRSTARGTPESGAQQSVRVKIFKKQLFCLRQDNLRPSRPFETKARPWAADFTARSDYQPIWSRSILDGFWYPVWLLPLTTLFLVGKAGRRGGSLVGPWWLSIAWASLLAPSLIDFGFFESETIRWLAVTALGAAIALGLSLASLWRMSPRWIGQPVVLALLALCSVGIQLAGRDMVSAYRNPGTPLPIGRPGLAPGSGLLPNPSLILEHHYGISPDVLEVAGWIRRHSRSGEHFVCDSWDLPTNARGVLIGAVGLLPAMEADPPAWARGIDSYQTDLQQRGFWITGDLRRLAPEVDWLLVTRSSAQFGKADFESGSARAYRVASVPPPPSPGRGHFSLHPANRRGVKGEALELSFEGPFGSLLEIRFRPLENQEFVADQNIQKVTAEPQVVIVTPYAAGEYALEARLDPNADWQDVGTFTTTEPESAVPWGVQRQAR